jgi:hypothetical protein
MAKKQNPEFQRRATNASNTPNDLADAQTQRDKARSKVVCEYLGKKFYEGDTINYKNCEWQCRAGKWMRTEDIDPNHLRFAQTPGDEAALQVTCQYMGKTFYGGDTICFESLEWQCGANGWVKTGNAC